MNLRPIEVNVYVCPFSFSLPLELAAWNKTWQLNGKNYYKLLVQAVIISPLSSHLSPCSFLFKYLCMEFTTIFIWINVFTVYALHAWTHALPFISHIQYIQFPFIFFMNFSFQFRLIHRFFLLLSIELDTCNLHFTPTNLPTFICLFVSIYPFIANLPIRLIIGLTSLARPRCSLV